MADSPLDTLLQELKNTVSNLKTLQIVTAVGPIKWDGKKAEPVDATSAKVMATTVDLIQGDKTTQMDPEFVTGSLQSLRAYHEEAAKEGHDIIMKNFEALKALADLIVHYKKTA